MALDVPKPRAAGAVAYRKNVLGLSDKSCQKRTYEVIGHCPSHSDAGRGELRLFLHLLPSTYPSWDPLKDTKTFF